jgi:glycosyltransferase involved in cell wall biosynthesis
LTVIVPVLKPDIELRRCIDSIRLSLQEAEDVEILIVTDEKHVSCAAEQFPGVKVIAETRPSIYGAMNDAAAESRGDYLYFLGKDDIMLPGFQQALHILKSTSPDFLSCDVYFSDLGTYSGRPSKIRLLSRNLCHQGIVCSRRLFWELGPFCRHFPILADYFFNIKVIWSRQPVRILYLKCPVAWYAGSGVSATKRDAKFIRLYPLILRKYVGRWAWISLGIYQGLKGLWRGINGFQS